MVTARVVAALLAYAVGMSIASPGMAQSATTEPAVAGPKPAAPPNQKPPAGATQKPAIVKPAAAQPASTTTKPLVAAPAGASKTTQQAAAPVTAKVPAGAQVGAPKPATKATSTQVAWSPAVRTPTGGRAMSTRPPATLRGTRYGAVPVMPSPYAPPLEKLPPPADDGSPRTLSFHALNTQESITVTYWRDGRYVQSELDKLNDFLRDPRDNDRVQMDPHLFDVLWHVRRNLASDAPYQVLSAYRSPQTNAWLASARRGVAWDSLHIRGQAIDVQLPGRTPFQIRQTARNLGLGGVGYYPRSGFVHIDTGPVRYW
ncbi:MAG TPA: DUF882 domain-containing protein [Vineibacter sp.]|nr:DUF882 domain-containing protein [Vineibacter sp.]